MTAKRSWLPWLHLFILIKEAHGPGNVWTFGTRGAVFIVSVGSKSLKILKHLINFNKLKLLYLFCLSSYYFFWSVSLGGLGSLLLTQTVVGEFFLWGDMFGVDDLLLKWLMTFLVGFFVFGILFRPKDANLSRPSNTVMAHVTGISDVKRSL